MVKLAVLLSAMAWSTTSHLRLMATALAVLVLCGGYSGLLGASAQLQLVNEFDGALPEPRAYIPDAGLLDFVYHNHDDMTKFLR